MTFFKGYVRTKNKACLKPFKDKKKLPELADVKDFSEYAGILAFDTILVDIDDFDESEILLDIVDTLELPCRVYETTRGKHFFFKNDFIENNKTHAMLACGINADIKLGKRNSYSILKFDGINRKIVYDKFNDEEYIKIPKWLYPIRSNIDFSKLGEGDGRNQTLFNYILTLQSNDFSVDDARECIRIINQFVLRKPLNEKELKTILRKDAFSKPIFFKNNQFLFDKFAIYLKNNYNIIKLNNQLHMYQDGVYKLGGGEIESIMIDIIPSLNRQKRSEVMSYLDILIRKNSKVSDAHLIAFKNGIYNIDTKELIDFNPNIIITNKVNYNYNPNAYSELVDDTLDKFACDDYDIRMLLEEATGYCLYRRNELRKSFILTGDKHNGKSTYLDMVQTLVGEENTASLDLKEIGDRFKTAQVFGKLANIGDDIGDEFIANAAMFKKVVSGESITVENKGETPFKFNPYCKFLFSANEIPRIKDRTGAVIDRLVIIPFDAHFSTKDPNFNPYIKYDLRKEENIEYLILLGLDGLKRVLKQRHFTESERVLKEIKEYEEGNNPAIGFFNDIGIESVENHSSSSVYKQYREFCLANGFQAIGNTEFTKVVKKHFDLDLTRKKINQKIVRVFVKEE